MECGVAPHFSVFGLEFSSYGTMFFVAFLVSYMLLAERAQELDKPRRWVLEAPIVALVSGAVGARLYYLLEHPDQWSEPFNWNGGNAWYGAFAGGAIGILVWRHLRGIPLLLVMDTAGMVLPFTQAIGRVGCLLAGDGDYGIRSDLPWAMSFPDGTKPTPPGVTVHPTPIYESVTLLAIGIFLWRRRDRARPGEIAALYLLLVGTERFLVEFIRINPSVAGPFTAAQLWSAAMMVGGAAWLIRLRQTAPPQPDAART
jgi:phosphatidylglycerol---prolipoprotein diacylglyceryl transferase